MPTNVYTACQLTAHPQSIACDLSSFDPQRVIVSDDRVGDVTPPSSAPAALLVVAPHKREASVQLTGINKREFIMYRY